MAKARTSDQGNKKQKEAEDQPAAGNSPKKDEDSITVQANAQVDSGQDSNNSQIGHGNVDASSFKKDGTITIDASPNASAQQNPGNAIGHTTVIKKDEDSITVQANAQVDSGQDSDNSQIGHGNVDANSLKKDGTITIDASPNASAQQDNPGNVIGHGKDKKNDDPAPIVNPEETTQANDATNPVGSGSPASPDAGIDPAGKGKAPIIADDSPAPEGMTAAEISEGVHDKDVNGKNDDDIGRELGIAGMQDGMYFDAAMSDKISELAAKGTLSTEDKQAIQDMASLDANGDGKADHVLQRDSQGTGQEVELGNLAAPAAASAEAPAQEPAR